MALSQRHSGAAGCRSAERRPATCGRRSVAASLPGKGRSRAHSCMTYAAPCCSTAGAHGAQQDGGAAQCRSRAHSCAAAAAAEQPRRLRRLLQPPAAPVSCSSALLAPSCLPAPMSRSWGRAWWLPGHHNAIGRRSHMCCTSLEAVTLCCRVPGPHAAPNDAAASPASSSGPLGGLDGRPNVLEVLRARGLLQEVCAGLPCLRLPAGSLLKTSTTTWHRQFAPPCVTPGVGLTAQCSRRGWPPPSVPGALHTQPEALLSPSHSWLGGHRSPTWRSLARPRRRALCACTVALTPPPTRCTWATFSASWCLPGSTGKR
jgi:hypothetical protein